MIARGDLAVECGYERLAEVQEEILWLCQAAHVPVIWATQVLDQLGRTGRPSRAEITDAAMGVHGGRVRDAQQGPAESKRSRYSMTSCAAWTDTTTSNARCCLNSIHQSTSTPTPRRLDPIDDLTRSRSASLADAVRRRTAPPLSFATPGYSRSRGTLTDGTRPRLTDEPLRLSRSRRPS